MFARGGAALFPVRFADGYVLVPVVITDVLRFKRRRVSYELSCGKVALRVVAVKVLRLPRRTCDTRWSVGDDVWIRMNSSERLGVHFAPGRVLKATSSSKNKRRLFVAELFDGRLVEAAAWRISSQTHAISAPNMYKHSFEQLCISGYPEAEAFLKSTVLENPLCFHWATEEILAAAKTCGLAEDDLQLVITFCDAFFSDEAVIYLTYHEAKGNGLAVLHEEVDWWQLRDVVVASIYHVESHVHLSMKQHYQEYSWAVDDSGNMIYLGFIARLINNSHEPNGYFLGDSFTFMIFAPVAERGEELTVMYNDDGEFCTLNGFKCCCDYCSVTQPLLFEDLEFPETEEQEHAAAHSENDQAAATLMFEPLGYPQSGSSSIGDSFGCEILVEELGFPEDTLSSDEV